MEKNKIYKGLVEGLGTGGEGIIKTEGTTAFVPFCLTGEEVSFKALKADGNIAYGKAEKIISPSPDRVSPPCPVFGKCGGCDLQHMNYSAQLEFKRRTVQNALLKIGGINCGVNAAVPCEKEYRYRNKLAVPIGEINGETECGFYGARSHRIVPVNDCLIQSEWVKKVISAVKNYSRVRNVPAYDEASGRGALRRIVVREIKNKFIFALVTAREVNADFLIKELEKDFKDFTFLLNINPSRGNALFSDDWCVLKGSGFFSAEECGIKYEAGANTFLQVNDGVREKLYNAVLNEVSAGDAVIDLYSGGGMLTAMLAKKSGLAYGVEVVKEASLCADALKKANGLEGKMFNICGKAEEEIDGVLSVTAGRRRVIVCDPPRKGMERRAVRAITSAKPEKIVLISCNPATLARDLGLILGTLEEKDGAIVKTGKENGSYSVESVTPFDMFPQTKWAETLVTLFHKKPSADE